MSSHIRHRRGLVLIELLVIVLCLVLLVTLLAPSVLAAREASRRSQCKNNLKQIGLALHNYHDTHRMFPPGWIPQEPVLESTAPSRWSWSVFILPFIDQAPLYNAMEVGRTGPGTVVIPKPGSPHDKLLPVFLCPDDFSRTPPANGR